MSKRGRDTRLPGQLPAAPLGMVAAQNYLPANSVFLPNLDLTSLRFPALRNKQSTDLSLTATAPPSMGLHPHTQTVPRAATQHGRRQLSSSGSKALEALISTSRGRHVRSNTTDPLLHRSKSPNTVFSEPLRRPAIRLPLSHDQHPQSDPLRVIRQRYVSALPPLASPNKYDPLVVSDELISVAGGSEVGHQSEEESEGETTATESESCDSDDEIFSTSEDSLPPSAAGFESEAEKSAQSINVQFPDAVNTRSPFPATLIQEHAQLDMEKFAASAHPSGLSPRVSNIVRAFKIHGPLDRELLSRAMNQVASLHPLLSATFQRTQDGLYIQTSQGRISVNLESPIVGHEGPQELVTNARRKLFPLTMRDNMCVSGGARGELQRNISLVSVVGSDAGGGETPPEEPKFTPKPLTGKKKSVTFAQTPEEVVPFPSLSVPPPSETTGVLMRARLVPKDTQERILVLSFPPIICDYWSSCLFVQQLSDAYGKLERSSAYHPSMAAMRAEKKRQSVIKSYEREKARNSVLRSGLHSRDAGSRLLHKRPQMSSSDSASTYIPPFPPRVHFHQVAQRESQLLKMFPKERLWSYWEAMVTATICRQRGPNRVKVIPPVRLPSGIGEKVTRRRPLTSRLRPLTARPQMARKSGVFGESLSREVLNGPLTQFHFIKVDEAVCSKFKLSLPEEHLAAVNEDDHLNLMCLGAYVLLLGCCCRGWGRREEATNQLRGRGDGASGSRLLGGETVVAETPKRKYVSDPLQKYREDSHYPRTIVVPGSPLKRAKRTMMGGGRLDLGSFLVGVEVSLRDCAPQQTLGVFGPLTNSVGIRVNLSSCDTFADLVVALGKTLQSARNHSHLPFSAVAEELGLIHGLPIRFSFLRCYDTIQLTRPENFYFPETAIGVEGHGLARFGNNCYLTPLSTKMDDSCHMELVMWESCEGDSVGGGIRFQPQAIRPDLVQPFGSELCRLLSIVAEDPCRPLGVLASHISPPFLSSSRSRLRRVYA